MTTEAVLLLGLFVFLLMGAFFGDSGPHATFKRSGPRLAARIEQQITTGRDFKTKDGKANRWLKPPAAPPDGSF